MRLIIETISCHSGILSHAYYSSTKQLLLLLIGCAAATALSETIYASLHHKTPVIQFMVIQSNNTPEQTEQYAISVSQSSLDTQTPQSARTFDVNSILYTFLSVTHTSSPTPNAC